MTRRPKQKQIIDKAVAQSETQTAIDKDICKTGDVAAGSNTADANINNVEQAHEDVRLTWYCPVELQSRYK